MGASGAIGAIGAIAAWGGAIGCADEEAPWAPPTMGEAEVVVPFQTPVEGVETQNANNNLDVATLGGRTFLAFRTAPTHFASPETEMFVVSSADGQTWTFETRIALGTDVREPRLLAYGGRLFLYFAVLGQDPLKFEPQGTMITERTGPGAWTEPSWWEDQPGFIPWRLKVVDGTAYMIGYTGGENIYEVNGEPLFVKWFRSKDGLSWVPVVEGQATVEQGGGSETDFVFLDDGSVVAVTRNEAGDETGWGSKICHAPASDLGAWTCAPDPKKYDSPLVFRHGEEVYLVARRNVTETGNYDLFERSLSPKDQTQTYLIEYSFAPKRCALWRVDPGTLAVTWLFDLPSRGDTCFPSMLPGATDDEVWIYNYTNAYDGDTDYNWIVGQGKHTFIYRIPLFFDERAF